ncbi:sortase [Chloroflexus sp.]|uniref:sortase n=1 Tax=Chloroflexus sp. TaxID=1904827 RepID=UPI002ADDC423|nr:sortase [Chloroflexus sp.]
MRVLLIVLTGCLLVSACGGTTASATVPSPTPEAFITPTAERLPSPQPSLTPSATPTHAPTATATPSATPTQPPTPAPSTTPTMPPVGDRTPVRLVIPEINLNRELIPVGLDAQNVPIVPDHDVGWYIYSAKPGQGENIVLWGHVLRFRKAPQIPAPFANIDRLQNGSEILLYSADGTAFRYVVARKERVTPDQVQYILPTGDERLTLVSCIGDRVIVDGNVELTHRLITIAVPAP